MILIPELLHSPLNWYGKIYKFKIITFPSSQLTKYRTNLKLFFYFDQKEIKRGSCDLLKSLNWMIFLLFIYCLTNHNFCWKRKSFDTQKNEKIFSLIFLSLNGPFCEKIFGWKWNGCNKFNLGRKMMITCYLVLSAENNLFC